MKNWNFRLKVGLFILSFFLILGFFFPLLYSGNITEWNTYPTNLKPSLEHFLGTNSLGQDIFWLLCNSIRNSFLIGLFVAFISTLIGIIAGLSAGIKGGALDRVVMLLADTFISIPSLPILILIGSLTKGTASLFLIGGVLILFNWPWPARQVRSMALTLRESDYISIARFSGESTIRILFKEIFPFVKDWSIGNFINTILVAISSESGLAVIGMSSNSKATLGTMIYWANQHQAMLGGKWIWIGSPVVAICLIFIGLFLLMTGQQQYSALRRGK